MYEPTEFAKILTYTAVAFLIALWWAPSLIRLLRWLRFWKKTNRQVNMLGKEYTDETLKKFYDKDESKVKIPRGGGLLIWINSLVFAFFFWVLLKIEPTSKTFQYLNFISRSQTFIPIGTLFFGSIFGFIDDALSTLESGGNYKAGGLKLSQRLFLITILSTLIGFWFYIRAGIHKVSIFNYSIDLSTLFGHNLSWLIVPFTVFVLLLLWGSSVIDGFDGLSGGVFIPIYLCFAAIAFHKGYFDVATLMAVIASSTMAFLWFNISPAKFYMGDTGSTGLLLTLGVVAILLDATYILPIAGIVLLATVFSNIIQISSKKFLGRKVFKAAPLHHHFEALGMKRNQIVLRYWMVTIVMSALGVAIAILIK